MREITDKFAGWLEQRPHRFTIINVTMLAFLLYMMDSNVMFALIGGLTLIVAGLYCVAEAAMLTYKNWKDIHPFQIALIWAPGAIALILSASGLYLAAQYDAGSAFYIVGCIMFGFEVAMLAILGAELHSADSSLKRYLEAK
ncbi:MAG: hypothetical protein DI626_06840 [Micavibrio aeruginosavorus]|uniref:Uncharacterized protein n=1 Tax=Micavibrio aeruginosavorus TaxID=349221 RepID=A0A2W4ZV27_9BACT|nr:MAG: hypothetical protein DI626_06840 [Micavibrio aeruginosavorus]